MTHEPLMAFFTFGHLPDKLAHTSQKFYELASFVEQNLDPGPERTVTLRKLLEAKDAAVRATLHPGI